MLNKNIHNTASLIHISTFAKYIFPFGNFILPLLIWSINRDKSSFIDDHGKRVLNFQFSILCYFLIILLICIPIAINFGSNLIHLTEIKDFRINDLAGFTSSIILLVLFCLFNSLLFIIDLLTTIIGAIKAREGKLYNYPLAINFIK
jgi:hypothetical protein